MKIQERNAKGEKKSLTKNKKRRRKKVQQEN